MLGWWVISGQNDQKGFGERRGMLDGAARSSVLPHTLPPCFQTSFIQAQYVVVVALCVGARLMVRGIDG